MPNGSDFLTPINAQGRLRSVEEFRDVVLKSGANGEVVRLGDVARVELAAGDYTLRARLDGQNAAAMGVFQSPGANALQIRDSVVAKMEELKKTFPPGVEYRTVYDTTIFVRDSIKAVVSTLLEATLLGRAGGDPVPADLARVDHSADRGAGVRGRHFRCAVPARLLDQHADPVRPGARDRHRGRRRDRGRGERRTPHREGATPLAGRAPGDEGSLRPIIAIALVLCAVFVPMAFLSGVTGQFYKQFAVTIAISTVISAINSLTLSPALAAMLLRGHDAPKDALSRLIERAFGWVFRPFNRFFKRKSSQYGTGVAASSATAAACSACTPCCWSPPPPFSSGCRAASSRSRTSCT
jgi:multidrug efflux pump